MDYPAKPLPEGGRLQPELAEADPMISSGGRVYTFTIRKDARFSDGSRVTARAFARAIERILDPAMQFPAWASRLTSSAAQKVLAGKTKKPAASAPRAEC